MKPGDPAPPAVVLDASFVLRDVLHTDAPRLSFQVRLGSAHVRGRNLDVARRQATCTLSARADEHMDT